MLKKSVNPRVYAALYLSKKTASEKVTQANYIVAQMTEAGVVFTSPVPDYTSVSGAASDLSIAITNAESGLEVDKIDLLQKENVLDNLMTRLKEYAENVANSQNDKLAAAAILLEGGFTLTKNPEKHPVPLPPANPAAIFTNTFGKILVTWKPSKYTRMNNVFMTATPDDAASWKFAGSTSKRKLMIENLAPMTRYYFRIVAAGSAGSSIPSNVVDNITKPA